MLVVGRITLARTPTAGWSPALAVAAGAIGLLAAWTLLSLIWSDAPFRALSEFDRVLAYTLVLCLMGSFATRAGDLDRALRWLAAAFAIVAAAALVTRLDPTAFPTNPGRAPSRLAFPLTYWNALGAACAIGVVLALHCTAGARHAPFVRVLGAGALPVLGTTLYFTFSRGGLVATALGVVLYVALAHPRHLALALPAAGIPAAVAVTFAYGADGLATGRHVPGEAQGVAAVVAGCVLAAMALRALCLGADRRIASIHISARTRRKTFAVATAVAGSALLVALLSTDLPRQVDDMQREFLEGGTIAATGDQRGRLLRAEANGRVQHWDVAVAAFRAQPTTGTGAGTFRLEWERERATTMNVADAHSLYLEMLAELGWPGLLLLSTATLTILAVAARRLLGPERHAHAAFVAASLALLVHAAIDWDWEMPVLFAWFFALGGIVCAAPVTTGHAPPEPGRYARIVGGLGCLVLAAAPATIAASQPGLDRGTRAFVAGDCAGAADGALDSLAALRARPEPYELLGYCNLRARRYALGLAVMRAARERDPHNWEYAYGLAVAQALNGQDPRPAAALALRLNPWDVRAQELHAALRRSGRQGWARVASRARVPFQ